MKVMFSVAGDPRGQPRPRVFHRGGKTFAVSMPSGCPAADWRAAVYHLAEGHRPDSPAPGPVRVELSFLMRRPKSHYGSGKHAGTLKAAAPKVHISRPDLDNLVKLILDVLTQLSYWRDDAQIAELIAKKYYADEPGADIVVEWNSEEKERN